MVILDTSVLVRYFTGDDKKKALLVAKLLASDENLLILDVVFIELEYVLMKLYRASRAQMLEGYQFLVSQSNITVSKEIQQAIETYSKITLSMADCVIAAFASSGTLASFDKDLLKKTEVHPYWNH